jgi:hypothetical protein
LRRLLSAAVLLLASVSAAVLVLASVSAAVLLLASGIMSPVGEQAHVTLSGDISGRYVVTQKQPDGELTLVPDISVAAILNRLGHEQATFEEFEAEYGSLRPSDGEG